MLVAPHLEANRNPTTYGLAVEPNHPARRYIIWVAIRAKDGVIGRAACG